MSLTHPKVTIGACIVCLLLCCSLAWAEDVADDLPLDAHLYESYCDDLEGLLKRRYIRVLTTLNRTNFFISKGEMFVLSTLCSKSMKGISMTRFTI